MMVNTLASQVVGLNQSVGRAFLEVACSPPCLRPQSEHVHWVNPLVSPHDHGTGISWRNASRKWVLSSNFQPKAPVCAPVRCVTEVKLQSHQQPSASFDYDMMISASYLEKNKSGVNLLSEGLGISSNEVMQCRYVGFQYCFSVIFHWLQNRCHHSNDSSFICRFLKITQELVHLNNVQQWLIISIPIVFLLWHARISALDRHVTVTEVLGAK